MGAKKMAFQWHIVAQFLLILFIGNVSPDGVTTIPTSFFGLQGDTNLGHSGYVHVSTEEKSPNFELSSCQNLDINESTCHFVHKVPKSDSALMVMRAWAAITIRDNILGLLGYLLHESTGVFTEDTYSSMRLIYEEVRKNNIKTMDILPRLKGIAKVNQISQITDLFRILQGLLPSYCKSAIDDIVRAFGKQKAALKTIFSTETGDKGLDVFTDIGLQIVPFLRSRTSRLGYDKSLLVEMGKEFAIFFSAIQESKIILTQPVLAVLMLNMRFNQLSPDDNEDFRYLIDVLRDSKIPDWSPGLIGAVNVKCPYVLVQMMIKAIGNRSQIDPVVKDIVDRLHGQLQKVPRSYRPNLMDPYFGKAELNTELLLNMIEKETKLTEVQTLKQMINDRTLSLSYALKGFVRYFYNTPRDLALAFMRRIQNRVPMNNETSIVVLKIVSALRQQHSNGSIEDNVGVLHNETTKSKRSVIISRVFPPSELSSVTYSDKDCVHGNQCFSKVLEKISKSYEVVNFGEIARGKCPVEQSIISLSDWLNSLNTSAVNVTVSNLLSNVSTVLATFVNDTEIQNLIDVIANRKVPQNNSMVDDLGKVIEAIAILAKGTDETEENSADSTSMETKRDFLTRILKDMLSIKKVRARRLVYYEVTRIYCILIQCTVGHMTKSFLDRLKLDDLPLHNITEIFSENISKSLGEIIQNFTANKNQSSFNILDYRSNRSYLIDLLKRLLLQDSVKVNNALFNEIVQLLRPILDSPIRIPPAIIGQPYNPIVLMYLQTPRLINQLGEDFDIGRYPTRGQLLKGILEKLLTKLEVRRNDTLASAIKRQIFEVICTGPGAEPVREVLDGITGDQVNVYKIIQYGIDRQKLTADVQQAFANMWSWYGGSFEPLTHVKQLNVSLYETRADFLHGFLDNVEERIRNDLAGIKRDIALMRSAILKTGSGVEPVDYL